MKNLLRCNISIIHIPVILIMSSLVLSSCKFARDDDFMIELGVCTHFNNAGMLAEHGYAYLEPSVGGLLMPDKSEEEFNEVLEQALQSGLPLKACNGFIPGRLKSVGPEAVHQEILEFAETAFRRGQQIGVRYIVFGSGGSRRVPDGFPKQEALRQFTDLCAAMAPVAAQYDIVVVLEPLNRNECNLINSLADGAAIVEAVNHPNFRLLADIYHMMMDDEGPDQILKYGHLIEHTHIAEKESRAAPGTHNEDFTPYFEALKKVGYRGMMSVESRWDDMETQAAAAIMALKTQLQNIR